MASSGNLQTDILGRFFSRKTDNYNLKGSQLITLLIGAFAILIAFSMTQVLDLMLTAYAFMVSGLLIPVIMGLFSKNPSASAALASMIIGGSTTVILILTETEIPFKLDENIIGLSASLITYLLIDNFIKLYKNGIYNIRLR
jgi:SSS family solute:Na+ symporter